MAIYEGAWDCPNCDRKANRGPEKHCGGCGVARGEEVPIYLPEDAPEVVEEAALARANSGPDWTCPYCTGDNPNNSNFCTNCGAGRDGSKARKVEDLLDKPDPPPAPPADTSGCAKKIGCGCLGLLLLVMLFSWLLGDSKADLNVVNHSWERSIQTEAYRTVRESAWAGEVPSGARQRGHHRELHHTDHIRTGSVTRTRTVNQRVQSGTRRVKAGKRNKGNGYFEDIYKDEPVYKDVSKTETYQEPTYRDDPVYRDKVDYDVEKWQEAQKLQSRGEGLTPTWPAFTANSTSREKSRQEIFTIKLIDKKQKNYVYTAKSEQDWRAWEDGKQYPAMVNGDKCNKLGK